MDEAAIGSWLQNSDSREKCARYYHRHNIYDCRDHHRHRHLLLGSRERCVQIYRSCSTVMYKHLSEVANKRQKKKNIYIYIYCIHHGCVHHIHHLRLLLLRHHHLHFHGCQERHIREKCVRSYHNCSKSLHQIPGSRERYGQVCCSCSMMLKK